MINKILQLLFKKADTDTCSTKEKYIKVALKANVEESKFYNLINTPFIKNLLNNNSLYVTMPYSDTDEVIGIIKEIKYDYILIQPDIDINRCAEILEKSEIHIDGLYKNNKLYKITSFYLEPIIKEIDIQKFMV